MCHMLFTLNHRGFKNLIIANLFPRMGSFTLELLGFLVVDGSDRYIYRDGFFPAQLQCKHEVEVWIPKHQNVIYNNPQFVASIFSMIKSY